MKSEKAVSTYLLPFYPISSEAVRGGVCIIPNILTTIRFLLIPVFLFTFYQATTSRQFWLPLIIFILSGITDVLDGYIARKYNMVTKLGTLLDPLADKLTLIAVMGCLATQNSIMLYLLVIVLIKESAMIIGAILLYKKRDVVVQANKIGKISTFVFFIAIILTLLRIHPFDMYVTIAAVCITLIALFHYAINYKEVAKIKD